MRAYDGDHIIGKEELDYNTLIKRNLDNRDYWIQYEDNSHLRRIF
jgi:hypothetical protein